ncbi:subtilisin-like protein [Aspergillus avenaceus]|uniref:tripeptidyl-peptidase II n=1 Tax=Aspergillus avenaceus TaxID=36643 RepID=A0A5N6U7C7_ASPAV|nr:subtilisin-like protein [Aspergillus avenaceus]
MLPMTPERVTMQVAWIISLCIAAPTLPVASGTRYAVVERFQRLPEDWAVVGVPVPSKQLKFQLAIRQERAAQLEQKVIDISTPGHPSYGIHMKRDEVRDFLRPSELALHKVLYWLEAAQVPAQLIEIHADWITFTVPVDQAQEMLKTRFYNFEHTRTKAKVIRTMRYSVPKQVQPYILMIQPTTRFGHLVSHVTPPIIDSVLATPKDLSANCSSTVTPYCLRELYGIYDSHIAPDPRNKLGVSGFLDQYARYSDFHDFLRLYAPNRTDSNFSVVSINGGLNLQDSVQISSEASLDIQYATTLAYNSFTTFYTTAGRGPVAHDVETHDVGDSDHEPYLEQLRYLLNLPDDELPAVLSTSYGEPEQDVPELYAKATCNMFAHLGARGVSVIFSSGDSGVGDHCKTNDGYNRPRFQPIYPASCPFVTSVGGTYGSKPEKAVSYSSGGFSEYFPRLPYQDTSVSTYFHQLGNIWDGLYNPNGRAIPDVAAQADQFIFMDHGRLLKTGGTSAAAPVFAAIVSQLNAVRLKEHKPRLGFLNPWIYSLNGTGFTDIIDEGSVGCFVTMADLRSLVSELNNALNRKQFDAANDLLSRAKRTLLLQNALIPTPSTSPELVALAREVLELGALSSIRQTDAPSFTRYYQQLQPFYDLERDANGSKVDTRNSQRSKITGLYLLLLLSMGDSTSFHTVLEGLVEETSLKGKSIEDDPYIKYPVDLERNLMEGSYDKVWRETNSERVPSEDFGLFSNVLVGTIRSEIADCSEKAYPSLPISNAKNLLFLESEGAVIEFAQQRGWVLRDGRIYFPVEPEATARSEKDILVASGTIIENAIGYARELETIV